ncbi:MAG: hypothetical protein WC454_09380 [Phycisphaerae bacterium]|jgi:hypothetical protein
MADKKMVASLILDASSYKQSIDMAKQLTTSMNKEMELWKIQNKAVDGSLKTLTQQGKSNAEMQKILSAQIEVTRKKLQEVTTAQGATSTSAITYKNKITELQIQQAKLNKEMDDAARNKIKAVGESFQKVGNQMASAGQSMTMGITVPLLAIGGATSKMAMDAIESENLFEVSMSGMAESARKWSEDLRANLGLNAYEVRKNVSTFNVMLDSMGMGEKASYDMAKGLTQLSYDMASFYNLKPEVAFEKLQAGISGEIEPLKRLGIVVNETTTKTYAYTHGIAKQGETLSEQQKILARYGVIMDATKKSQGDLARTIDSPTNQIRIMGEKVKQLSIDFGMALIPVIGRMIEIAKPLIANIQGLVEGFRKLNPETQNIVIVMGLVIAAIGPALVGIGKMSVGLGALAKAFAAASGAATVATPAMGALSGAAATTAATASLAVGPWLALAAAVAGTMYLVNGAIKENGVVLRAQNAPWMQTAAYMQGTAKAAEKATLSFGDFARAEGEAADQRSKDAAAAKEAARALADLAAGFSNVGATAKDAAAAEKEAAEAAEEVAKKAREALISNVNNLNSAILSALKRRYEAQKKLDNSALDAETANLEKWKTTQLKYIDEIHDKAIAALDAETASKVSAIQAQIDAINSQQEAEEKARQDKEYQDSIASLKSKLATESDADERASIQEDLNEELAAYNKWLHEEEIQAQKDALQKQIDDIRAASDLKKDQLDADLANQEASLNAQYENDLSNLNKRKTALDTFYEAKESAASLNAEAEELIMDGSQKNIIALLKTYGDLYEDSGMTLGERLLAGIKTYTDLIPDLVSSGVTSAKTASNGGSSSSGSGNATATTPTGKTVSVTIVNGKTQDSLPKGTVVHTAGGDYKITGGTAGNYTSTKLAEGTNNAPAGWALTGEKGPELIKFKGGEQVIPNHKLGGDTIYITITGNTIAKDIDIDEIGDRLVSRMKSRGVKLAAPY